MISTHFSYNSNDFNKSVTLKSLCKVFFSIVQIFSTEHTFNFLSTRVNILLAYQGYTYHLNKFPFFFSGVTCCRKYLFPQWTSAIGTIGN